MIVPRMRVATPCPAWYLLGISMIDETDQTAVVRAAYARCRRMQRRYDPTFFLATARLPRHRRPVVHALYGFFRGADEIVDGRNRSSDPDERSAALTRWLAALQDGLSAGHSTHPILAALVHAGQDTTLPLHLLDTYMASMRVDCDDRVRITEADALDHYMNGSAATVGRVMAPVMGVAEHGTESLAQLGVAFQLTNFIRDVREDWTMDRLYLPGLDEATMRGGTATPELRAQVAVHVDRARRLFAATADVDQLVPASMRRGVRLAREIYVRVLDRVEQVDFDVLQRRTTIGPRGFALAGVQALR